MSAYAHDEDTYDLLALVADPSKPVGRDLSEMFLDACRRDAMSHDGIVSVSRVREAMAPHIGEEHHRYASLWSRFTGAGRPMVREGWEPCTGSESGNNGKPYPVRRWVG